MKQENESKPRHELKGIQAVLKDIDNLRWILNNPRLWEEFPITMSPAKNRRRLQELRRLYTVQERFAQTGK